MAEKFDNPNYNPEAGMKYLATHFEMFKPEVAKAMIADAKRKGVKIPPVVEAKARKAGILNSVRVAMNYVNPKFPDLRYAKIVSEMAEAVAKTGGAEGNAAATDIARGRVAAFIIDDLKEAEKRLTHELSVFPSWASLDLENKKIYDEALRKTKLKLEAIKRLLPKAKAMVANSVRNAKFVKGAKVVSSRGTRGEIVGVRAIYQHGFKDEVFDVLLESGPRKGEVMRSQREGEWDIANAARNAVTDKSWDGKQLSVGDWVRQKDSGLIGRIVGKYNNYLWNVKWRDGNDTFVEGAAPDDLVFMRHDTTAINSVCSRSAIVQKALNAVARNAGNADSEIVRVERELKRKLTDKEFWVLGDYCMKNLGRSPIPIKELLDVVKKASNAATSTISAKALNAVARNYDVKPGWTNRWSGELKPGTKITVVDSPMRYGGMAGEVVRRDGSRYVVRLDDIAGTEVQLNPNQISVKNAVARNASGLDGLIADLDSRKYDSIAWMPKVIGPGTLYPDGMKFPTGLGYDDEEKVRAAWKSGKYASVELYKGGSKRGEIPVNAATSTISEKALNAATRNANFRGSVWDRALAVSVRPKFSKGNRVKVVGHPMEDGVRGIVEKTFPSGQVLITTGYDKDGHPYTVQVHQSYLVRNSVVQKAINAARARNAADDFVQYHADSYSYIPKVGETYKYDGKRVKCTSVQELQRGSDDRDRYLIEGRVVG